MNPLHSSQAGTWTVTVLSYDIKIGHACLRPPGGLRSLLPPELVWHHPVPVATASRSPCLRSLRRSCQTSLFIHLLLITIFTVVHLHKAHHLTHLHLSRFRICGCGTMDTCIVLCNHSIFSVALSQRCTHRTIAALPPTAAPSPGSVPMPLCSSDTTAESNGVCARGTGLLHVGNLYVPTLLCCLP